MGESESSIWAITSYFNPGGYNSRLRNFRVFREHLRIPLVVVEFSQTGVFEIPDEWCEKHVKLSDGDVLWQKEALLNAGIRHLPDEVEHVAILDADILFLDPDWAMKAVECLRQRMVIQPFSYARYLTKEETKAMHERAIALDAFLGRERTIAPYPSNNGCKVAYAKACAEGNAGGSRITSLEQQRQASLASGFALAARREFFDQVPLFDEAVIGGADMLFWDAIAGAGEAMAGSYPMSESYMCRYMRWAETAQHVANRKIGWIDGEILHLWHGAMENRGYTHRQHDLHALGFDPILDLRRTSDGIWRWAEHRDDLRAFAQSYFRARAEDE